MDKPVNPYEPVQLTKEESDATRQGFWRALFSNWFTRDLLLITLFLGILGLIECEYRRSYFSFILIVGSLLFGLRHLEAVSPTQFLIRILMEIGLAYLMIILIVFALLIYLMLFVPSAFSH